MTPPVGGDKGDGGNDDVTIEMVVMKAVGGDGGDNGGDGGWDGGDGGGDGGDHGWGMD